MFKSTSRNNSIKRRRNFLPALIVIILLWLLTAFLVYFVEPSMPLAIPFFFILVFSGLLFTLATVFANSRRGFIAAGSLTIFLILRFFGLGHILNFLLLLALGLCLELYFNRSN